MLPEYRKHGTGLFILLAMALAGPCISFSAWSILRRLRRIERS